MKSKICAAMMAAFIFGSIANVEAFTEYNPENVDLLAHLIMGEAEGGSWELKVDVGSVALNRVEDNRFPNDIEEVIFQEGQYSCTWDGRFDLEPNWECYEAAAYILEKGSQLPEEVVWQAEFTQGDYIFKQVENMYFCV